MAKRITNTAKLLGLRPPATEDVPAEQAQDVPAEPVKVEKSDNPIDPRDGSYIGTE